ncbi:MAG TPA: metallophosphoesterase, partial [Anaerolineales bacterium]|nr:metallophosphoesterase [Anaerolineales bacterium]
MRKDFTRRDFLKILRVGAIDLALLTLGGAGYGFLFEPSRVKVESISLKLRRLTQAFHGIRLAQISDIHMGGWMNAERLQHVADILIAQRPDLLLLTGDFLIGHIFDKSSE